MNNTGSTRNVLADNRPSTSDNSSFPNPNKRSTRRKNVSAVDMLSHSKNKIYRHGKTTSRALSDYESGDSDIEKAGSSSASISTANIKGASEKTTSEDVCLRNGQFEESSNSDSDGLAVRLNCKRGSMRALSDYETGDSIEQAKESSNLSQVDQNLDNATSSLQQNDDLDLSSENESLFKVKKRPHNLFSTSDSSDSDTPVKQQSIRKRKRINSSSEDENVNAAQTGRRDRTNQNDLPRTNGHIHISPPRPRVNNRRPHIAAESGSSSCEILLLRIIRSESETDSDYGNEILRRMIREDMDRFSVDTSSNSSQENLVDGLSSDDQLNRRVTVRRITEPTQSNSRPPTTRRQVIRRTRRSRVRNSALEALRRISSIGRESETSSDESSEFNRFGRSQPPQSYIDSSDTVTILPFESRRARGGSVQIRYSDSDSNSEQILPNIIDNTETGISGVSLNPLNPSIIPSDNSSDADVDSEKCPICFSSFGLKEVASPESCDHSFCTKCIEEWAKNNNTCPIDRKHFNRIVVSRSFNNNEVLREITVQAPSPGFMFGDIAIADYGGFSMDIDYYTESSDEELEEICCVCFSRENSQTLIPCAFCSNVYHLSCLTPPLRYVPAYNWFCPQCIQVVEN